MTIQSSGGKTIREPARDIKVCYEADVAVLGGGPAGHAAAVAAARCGAKAVLLERYGHLGGMTTGGLVTFLHDLSDGTQEQQISGQCQEWIDRLDVHGGALHPKKEEVGSSDTKIVSHWQNIGGTSFVTKGRIILSVRVDPEILKCVLNDMVKEAGVKLFLHAWGTEAIVEDGKVKGVIFESKSGRQAILAQTVIDASGDGDLFPSAGVEFETQIVSGLRIDKLSLPFLIANIDFKRAEEFRKSQPEKHAELMHQLEVLGGFPKTSYRSSFFDNVMLFTNFIPNLSPLKVEDLTELEVKTRERVLITHDFYKAHVPGFERSFIMLTAPQIGTRLSRRLVGEYMVIQKDVEAGKVFDDTIGMFPGGHVNREPKFPNVHIPYRSLVPKSKVEGILVAGRNFSAEDIVHDRFNLIPHCIVMGQAAGTAAALAVQAGVSARNVNRTKLQESLLRQGVPLPKISQAQSAA